MKKTRERERERERENKETGDGEGERVGERWNEKNGVIMSSTLNIMM